MPILSILAPCPLTTVTKTKIRYERRLQLTRDSCGSSEGCCYIFVQLDVHVPLLGDLHIPGFDPLPEPVGEDVLHDARTDIADPLLGDLVDLLVFWHVAVYIEVA